MPRRARRIAESGIYHVMMRGVNRDAIFLEEEDGDRFLLALDQTRELSGCRVLAYCLMPNHVHLVLRIADEPIGAVIKRLGVRYAGWFNRKYGRVGHLFQDRFRSEPVEDDAYFVSVIRYVWDNPVEAGLAPSAEKYRWSSRRFLGRPSLVDEAELRRLMPPGAMDQAASVRTVSSIEDSKTHRLPRYTEDEVGLMLAHACGARSAEDFRYLSLHAQRRAICELRTRSVSYAQIARATGLSNSRVRRVHIAGEWTARAVA